MTIIEPRSLGHQTKRPHVKINEGSVKKDVKLKDFLLTSFVLFQMWTNAVPLTMFVTRTQTVKTPLDHLPALVKLDTAGMV